MTAPTVSVVIPVHDGADPNHFLTSLRSVAAQTRLPDDVIVVADGPLFPAHIAAIRTIREEGLDVAFVELPVHQGISGALQAGLAASQSTWIARMDADDIAVPGRLEAQLALASAGTYDVVGSAMAEFEHDPGQTTSVRSMPATHESIVRLMVRANPMNHPTVLFRRGLAIDVGGYRGPDGLEDYDLWARMLRAGARFANLDESLVKFRADENWRRRRKSSHLVAGELRLQRNLLEYGITDRLQFATNLVARCTFRLLPARLMHAVTRKLYRRPR